MKELANRLAMQHLVNAYAQETGNVTLLEKYQQNSAQISFSQGLTLLSISLETLHAQVMIPLSYVSLVGRHRLAALPAVFIKGQLQAFSSVAIVSLILENLISHQHQRLDSASLIERWIQSRNALEQFLKLREHDFDKFIALKQNFIETEQSLITGHSMHPAPKSRTGFIHEDWDQFSPETCGKTQLHFCLVAPEYIAEDAAFDALNNQKDLDNYRDPLIISEQLKEALKWHLSNVENALLDQYAHFKLLPLHPWQARYLQGQNWFKKLKRMHKLIDLGQLGWQLSPTTSIRTLASFEAPWQFKPSLSVMVTNSVRVNLEKEAHRGVMTHKLWHSPLGQRILKECPTLKAVNDPAWIALKLDGQIINQTLCIFREQPFQHSQQITCIASLCEDHPTTPLNRFNTLFEEIISNHNQQILKSDQSFETSSQLKQDIALSWFEQFLKISLEPMMYVYHHYGMAFEAHQQNVLLELGQGLPKQLWLRDNQGFYYIEELAQEVLKAFPELSEKAQAVGSKAFVDERFSYYFFGNTLFGIINAIGSTGYISEKHLLESLTDHLSQLLKRYPESTLIHGLLYNDTLPYKGNLLTRLHELDELTASVAEQSIYIKLANPLQLEEKDAAYA